MYLSLSVQSSVNFWFTQIMLDRTVKKFLLDTVVFIDGRTNADFSQCHAHMHSHENLTHITGLSTQIM